MPGETPTSSVLYAVVLAWNHVSDTLECLESLLQSNCAEMRVVLVDNGSTDGTQQIVADRFSTVYVLRTELNVGIAQGYNLGIEYALDHQADYILILNNDTTMDPGMVDALLRELEAAPQAGMAMPKILHYYGRPDRIWCAGARWRAFPPSVKQIGADADDGPDFDHVREIEFAPSCCLLVSRNAFQAAGLFDPGYYFYFDDWDLCLRVRRAGFRILFVPDARMWHKVAISTRKSSKPATWYYTMGASSVRFYLNHKTPSTLMFHSLWFVLREMAKLHWGNVLPFIFGVIGGLARHWEWQPRQLSGT